MDKAKGLMLEALRAGAAAGQEQRLYRSGKLPGLFAARTSLHIDAAGQAVKAGFLEIIRTELRGKTPVEYAKVTAQGMEYLLAQDSPVRALDELKGMLETQQDGLPRWLAEFNQRLEEMKLRFTSEIEALGTRLKQLTDRAAEAMRRVDKSGPPLPEGAAGNIPWAHDAATYLDQRRNGGLDEKCPLPELFAALKSNEADLSIKDFHLGLRRLHDRGVLRLLPHEDPQGPAEPEFALLDGQFVYYFAAR